MNKKNVCVNNLYTGFKIFTFWMAEFLGGSAALWIYVVEHNDEN